MSEQDQKSNVSNSSNNVDEVDNKSTVNNVPIRETPVYLVPPAPGGTLSLLQFQTRPQNREISFQEAEVFTKPIQGRMKFRNKRPTRPQVRGDDSDSFDEDPKTKEGKEKLKRKLIAKNYRQELESHIIPLQVQHGILMRHDDKIFITPLNSIQQVTPCFDYIDEINEAQKEAERIAAQPEINTFEAADLEEDLPSKIEPSFEAPQTDRQVEQKLKSWKYTQEILKKEKWLKTTMKPCSDPTPYLTTEDTSTNLELPAEEHDVVAYTRRLFPSSSNKLHQLNSVAADAHAISKESLKRLSLCDQALKIMQFYNIATWDMIKNSLVSASSEIQLLRAVFHSATWIHGRFIAKSNIVVGHSRLLIAARNLILQRFIAMEPEGPVSCKSIAASTSLLRERVQGLLENIADPLPDNPDLYRLKLKPDKQFENKYPKICEGFRYVWLVENSTAIKDAVDAVLKGDEQDEATVITTAEYKKNIIEELGLAGSGADIKEDLIMFANAMWLKHGVVNMEFFLHALDELIKHHTYGSRFTQSSEVYHNDLKTVVSEKGVEIQSGLWVAMSCGDENRDTYRKLVIDHFKTMNSIKRADFNDRLSQSGLENPSTSIYQRVMKEFAVSHSGKWVLKSGDGRL